VNLEIALSGVSAKVKLSQPVFRRLKLRETSDDVIKDSVPHRRVLSRDFSEKLLCFKMSNCLRSVKLTSDRSRRYPR